ncbi:DUF3301 domain-containing protein [Simiduia sp. 21SJ11W-1]|uniref:DUF3301 domain-containing protein n=1 Tax=Simiduia sp. 21SJ11W-1 TaxID=2909669 RepID=UPI00209FB7B5|nr:DUF3301 domain-containing protein [Simiduia sp. 21SJ11W-1]UTA47343.1 DUF3301 domain-containing protein [Simiduia sp. 21SJ11W-1]
MLELTDLILLFVVCWFGWYTLRVARIKEITVNAVRRRCEADGLQLLDGTIALYKLSLGRDRSGWVRVRRIYGFEFTATGEDRNSGLVSVLGNRLEAIELSPHRI